ncbi:hypothetical protein, partial [Carboxydocella sp. JDF658]|uniref:hypothetical protein n=1 Tax=Carboxydocella sp. JDF658 TaxID=1926600 RepID=UPI001A9A654B
FTTFEAGVNFSLSLLFCAKNPFLYTFFWGKFIFDISLSLGLSGLSDSAISSICLFISDLLLLCYPFDPSLP